MGTDRVAGGHLLQNAIAGRGGCRHHEDALAAGHRLVHDLGGDARFPGAGPALDKADVRRGQRQANRLALPGVQGRIDRLQRWRHDRW